jgi:hypothetical protein
MGSATAFENDAEALRGDAACGAMALADGRGELGDVDGRAADAGAAMGEEARVGVALGGAGDGVEDEVGGDAVDAAALAPEGEDAVVAGDGVGADDEARGRGGLGAEQEGDVGHATRSATKALRVWMSKGF